MYEAAAAAAARAGAVEKAPRGLCGRFFYHNSAFQSSAFQSLHFGVQHFGVQRFRVRHIRQPCDHLFALRKGGGCGLGRRSGSQRSARSRAQPDQPPRANMLLMTT